MKEWWLVYLIESLEFNVSALVEYMVDAWGNILYRDDGVFVLVIRKDDVDREEGQRRSISVRDLGQLSERTVLTNLLIRNDEVSSGVGAVVIEVLLEDDGIPATTLQDDFRSLCGSSSTRSSSQTTVRRSSLVESSGATSLKRLHKAHMCRSDRQE